MYDYNNRLENKPDVSLHPRARWTLASADGTLRLFITVYLVLLTIGYSIGLVFVDHTSTGTPQGLTEQYRGTTEGSAAAELKYAKSADEMFIFLHNHILSLAMVFFTVGALFYFSSSTSEPVKKFLMAEPIIAIGTTFGGLWLVRFVSDYFVWLVIGSGITMLGCYLFMVILILKELWIEK